jgi:ligand-binding sensor domain-containing protein
MATWAHGFYIGMRVNRSLKEKETAPESLTAFEFDKDEQGKPFMWCGGGAYGLMAYDTSEKKFFYFKNDPRDKYTHNLGTSCNVLRDTSSGIVWIGTENGLEKYDPHTIRFRRYRIWQDRKRTYQLTVFF